MFGAKLSTEDTDSIFLKRWSGRGAFPAQRSSVERRGGAQGRENVGMSNRKSDEKSDHRKPKVSLAMEISQGLGEPKATPKGLADGQPVNIPAPLHFSME
jgi:hypothetical protein